MRPFFRFLWKLAQYAGVLIAFNAMAGLIMVGLQAIYGQLNLSFGWWTAISVFAAAIVFALFTTPEDAG